jgi:hypothetical protein
MILPCPFSSKGIPTMARFVSRLSGIAGIPAISMIFLAGCSVFQSSREIDMTPFAQNTALMFAEAAKVGRPPRWDYLKPYYSIPELREIRVRSEPVLRGLRGIVMYSNQLVALNMSTKTDKEKNKLLAAYLREVAAKVADRSRFDSIGVSPSMLDSVFSNIERAATYREGIEAASTLVNAIVLAMLNRLDDVDQAVPIVIGAVDRAIDEEYAEKRANYTNLVRLQTQSLHAMTLLYDGKGGDRAALEKLLEVDPSMREFFASPANVTSKELKAAEESLTMRLERINTFVHHLDDEKAVYSAKQRELETLRVNVEDRIKIARDALMFWAQSHRNLGAGIAVPPLIDVGGIATGLAKKVVPLP